MKSATDAEVADVFCRYVARHHYENFWATSWIVPADIRGHLERVYAFCRFTDDLGDEGTGDATGRLELWRQDLDRCFCSALPPLHPVLLALADTIATFRLPREPFFDLVDANIQDQRVDRYETWDELTGYCRLSAAPVGRMVLGLFGFRSPALQALSDDVCIGLQLANFAQDVKVDAEKGRTYLVQSDLRALGTAGAVRSMCAHAERLLQSGRLLEGSVTGRLRLQLALYRLGGEAILREIEAIDYRTDAYRPCVPTRSKISLLAAGSLQVLGGRIRHGHHDQSR